VEGRQVYVVGAGNSAGQAAMHLSKYASRVTLLVRGDTLASTMSEYLITEVEAAENVDVRLNTCVVGGGGRGRLERLVLEHSASGTTETIAAAALFVLIGARPHTDWLPDEVERDEGGYVVTGQDLSRDGFEERAPLMFETSMPGVFAAGDVRYGSVKRVASAVGAGAIAIQSVHEYLRLAPRQAGVVSGSELAPMITGR
jgi:thioredoxin reductase (NADPH)